MSIISVQTNCTNDYGCSFYQNDKQKETLILVIVTSIGSTFMLLSNFIVLMFYLKLKKESWLFDQFCITMLFVVHLIYSIFLYFDSYVRCSNLEEKELICLIRCCFLFLIFLMLSKYNFLIGIERLVTVRLSNVFKFKLKLLLSFKSSILIDLLTNALFLIAAFSPVLFKWHNSHGCYCDFQIFNIFYVIFNCLINSILIISTIIIYLYIYIHVIKKMNVKIVNESTVKVYNLYMKSSNVQTVQSQRRPTAFEIIIQNSSDILNRTKKISKLKVLRTQTISFVVFFVSWVPNLLLTVYDSISEDRSFSDLRTYSMVLVGIGAILMPILYTYRLKFMKNIFKIKT